MNDMKVAPPSKRARLTKEGAVCSGCMPELKLLESCDVWHLCFLSQLLPGPLTSTPLGNVPDFSTVSLSRCEK